MVVCNVLAFFSEIIPYAPWASLWRVTLHRPAYQILSFSHVIHFVLLFYFLELFKEQYKYQSKPFTVSTDKYYKNRSLYP